MANGFTNYNKNISIVHRINPTAKLVTCIFLLALAFMSHGLLLNSVLSVITIIFWFASKMSKKATFSLFISVIIMLLVLLVLNWAILKSPGLAIWNDKDVNIIFGGGGWYQSVSSVNDDALATINQKYYYTVGSSWGMEDITAAAYSYAPGRSYNDMYNELMKLTTAGGDYVGYKLVLKQVISEHYMYYFYKSTWYTISFQVFFYSINIATKIFIAVSTITVLVSSTTNTELTNAISVLLWPLRVFKAPITEWSMVISLAIRFVPTLLDESQKILNAQASRGVDFKNGNLPDKAKALVSLVIPMFLISFIKANDLAAAMEVRNYNPRYRRTQYRSYRIAAIDIISIFLIFIILGLTIMVLFNNVFIGFYAKSDLLLTYS